ncbi:hypothetical protein F2P81_020435 [Scophthalmus maximus]|uniref:Uncharacterized protein n=1 Tax=Scophthalmus maximus TaxID=52904 RepID=A0A6A4SAC2_SCOMX|nr:hypothetical protein F2P81_020435 [Scophthalmus maximus]
MTKAAPARLQTEQSRLNYQAFDLSSEIDEREIYLVLIMSRKPNDTVHVQYRQRQGDRCTCTRELIRSLTRRVKHYEGFKNDDERVFAKRREIKIQRPEKRIKHSVYGKMRGTQFCHVGKWRRRGHKQATVRK